MKNTSILLTSALIVPFILKSQDTPLPSNEGYTISEVIIKDSVSADDLMKRAIAWAQKKHPKYEKINAVGGTNKVECDVEFKIKPKELNPPHDFSGKITMHVKIEVKFGKYKYTINKVQHIADNGKNSGGDITKEIAECGSVLLPELTWKKIKREGILDTRILTEDIKDAMSTPAKTITEDW